MNAIQFFGVKFNNLRFSKTLHSKCCELISMNSYIVANPPTLDCEEQGVLSSVFINTVRPQAALCDKECFPYSLPLAN